MTIGRYRVKPSATSPLIDWQSPYLDRVAFLTFCNEMSAGSLLDRVSGRSLSPGSTSSMVNTAYGKAAHLDSSTNSVWGNPNIVPFNTPAGTQTGDVTMLILASILPEARNSLIIGQSDAAADICGFSFLANFNSSFAVASGTLMVDCYNSGDQAISGAGLIDGTFHVYCGRRKGGTLSLFSDGVLIGSVASTIGIVKAGSQLFFGNHIDGTCTGDIAFAIGWNRGLSDQEVKAFSSQLWDTFLLDDTGPASTVSTISGTSSITLADATAAATGTLLIQGTASPTLAAATSAATGTLLDTGLAAITLAPATSTATGTLLDTGQAAITLAAATAAATGTLLIQGTVAKTLANATAAATGTLLIQGTLTKTLAPATSAATGTLQDTGTASVTLAPATVTATGTLLDTGTASITLASATAAAAATLLIQGTASITLAPLSLAATGSGVDTGVAADTLAPATVAATGALALQAVATLGLAPATITATAGFVTTGQASLALAAATLAGTGGLAVQGTSSVALDPTTLVASAGLAVQAVVTITLDDTGLVATATLGALPHVNVVVAEAAWRLVTVSDKSVTLRVSGDALVAPQNRIVVNDFLEG